MTTPPPLHDRRYRPADPSADLSAAAARLHDAFAEMTFDPAMVRAPGSVDDAELADLGGPVAELAPALVARFVLKAGTSWGGHDDLRRVAPRTLVLAADHALAVDRAVLWSKLRRAGWPHWPGAQVTAVHAFLRAEWVRLLGSDPRPAHSAHRWLRDVTAATDDLVPFLDDWHDALGPLAPPPHHRAAACHLVGLLVDSPLRPDHPATVAEVLGPDAPPSTVGQLTTWLSGPGTAHELRRAADALAGTRDARRVALAVDRLARFTAAVDRPASGRVRPERPRRGACSDRPTPPG